MSVSCKSLVAYTIYWSKMVQEKYKLELPEYPGGAQCVALMKSESKKDPSAMRLNYDVAERQGGLLEEHVDKDPLKQFDR